MVVVIHLTLGALRMRVGTLALAQLMVVLLAITTLLVFRTLTAACFLVEVVRIGTLGLLRTGTLAGLVVVHVIRVRTLLGNVRTHTFTCVLVLYVWSLAFWSVVTSVVAVAVCALSNLGVKS